MSKADKPGRKGGREDVSHQVHNHEQCEHGTGCGHIAIEHDGHVDYVSDGHMTHKLGDAWKDCAFKESVEHPTGCTSDGEPGCWAHDDGETCGPDCGHEAVPHDDHVDYLVPDGQGRFEMHCPHDGHCDHHGNVKQHVPPRKSGPL